MSDVAIVIKTGIVLLPQCFFISPVETTFSVVVVLSCGFFLVFPVLNQNTILTSQSADSENSKAPEPPKPKKNRCFMCRKKVGLTGNIKQTFANF